MISVHSSFQIWSFWHRHHIVRGKGKHADTQILFVIESLLVYTLQHRLTCISESRRGQSSQWSLGTRSKRCDGVATAMCIVPTGAEVELVSAWTQSKPYFG